MGGTNSRLRSGVSDSANLDILRSFAVMSVLSDHVLEAAGIKTGMCFHPLDWYLGRMGVLMFFVHTSLVLMHSLERLSVSKRRLLARFYVRRVFRIYPLSMVTVLGVVALSLPPMPWATFQWHGYGNLASNLMLTMNFTRSTPVLNPLWSLPLEVQMYVVLPLVFLCLRGTRPVLAACTLWLLAVGVATVQSGISDRLSVAQFAPCFMAGVIAYTVGRTNNLRLVGRLWPLAIVALIGFYLFFEEVDSQIHSPMLGWFFCLALGSAIPFFKDLPGGLFAKVGRIVARYSYGIYLLHIVALWGGLFALQHSPLLLQVIVSTVLLVALPVASYHLVEAPLIRVGRKLSD
ncbi:MAG TPA: acyltransferase [bacterium]